MKILGISALNHDASLTLLNNKDILFSAHSERYSGVKNDEYLSHKIFADCFRYGYPDKVVFFERPYLKKARQLYAGQYREVLNRMNLPSKYLKKFLPHNITYIQHHTSHACASYFTSPYDESAIVKALDKAAFNKEYRQLVKNIENPYGDGGADLKIVSFLKSIDVKGKSWFN